MKRRAKIAGKKAVSRRRKTAAVKRSTAPRAARSSSEGALETEVIRLTHERDEALEQQTATSEVLQVISSFAGELEPVFQAILLKATRICQAKFGVLMLREGDGFRMVAIEGAPPA